MNANFQSSQMQSFQPPFPQNFLPLPPNPENLFHFSLLFQQLLNTNYRLSLELQQLKSQMTSTKNQSNQPIPSIDQQSQQKKETEPVCPARERKIYTKDKKCTIQGCNRRYSSKIALNAHLRKHHHIPSQNKKET